MSMGLIPPSEISQYINMWMPGLKYEFDEDQMDYLLESIERLDDIAFKHYNKSSKSETTRPRAIVGEHGEMLASF